MAVQVTQVTLQRELRKMRRNMLYKALTGKKPFVRMGIETEADY
jgi:hypothetical protein